MIYLAFKFLEEELKQSIVPTLRDCLWDDAFEGKLNDSFWSPAEV